MYFSQVLYGFPNVDAYARTSEEMDGTLPNIPFLKIGWGVGSKYTLGLDGVDGMDLNQKIT